MPKVNKEKYHDGKMPKLWDYLVKLHKENPAAFEVDGGYLREQVLPRWGALKDKTHCPNCDASMQQYNTSFDYFDAKLLEAMGDVVKINLAKGMDFTHANRVHIQKDCKADYTTKSRQTKCRTLGLVAKVMKDEGKVHDQEAGWVITRRGWDALKGKQIPKTVVVFRNDIISRSDEMTSMVEVMSVKQDSFTPSDYYSVASLASGVL